MIASEQTKERVAKLVADAKAVADRFRGRMSKADVYKLAVQARSLARHATVIACLLERASTGGQEETNE